MKTHDDDRDPRGAARSLPPRLDPRAGSAAARRLPWTGRIVAGLVALTVLVTSGWGWYLGRVADATVNRTDAIPTTGNNGGDGEAMNLLLVGNDSRAGATEQQLDELNTTAHE